MKKKINPFINLPVTEMEKDILIKKLQKENKQLKKQKIELLESLDAKNSDSTLIAEDAAKYKSLIESSPDSILTIDLNNQIQFINLTDKNYDTTNLVGSNILNFLTADEIEKVKQCHRDAINTKLPQSYEIVTFNEKLVPRYFMTKVGPIITNNKVIGLTLIARDITERKKTEDKLVQSLSLLEATIESTADGILVANNEGEITLVNKKFIELWKIPSYILSMKEDEMAIQFLMNQLIAPELFLEKVKELYSNPEATSFDILYFKDGRVFERYSQAQLANGKYVGRVWCFRDVSEQIHAQDALKNSQLNFEQAQSISKVGSWEHSFITNKLIWSKELYRIFALAYKTDDSLYERYKKRIHPDDLDLVLNTLKEGLETGKEYTLEHRIVVENAEIKYIRGIGQAVFNDDLIVIGLKGTAQDITKEYEAKEKIKKSLLENEILLKEIHHRVKNNLQVISSILNLQAGLVSDEITLNVLRDSQNRIKCMSLVHELLYNTKDFSRINFSEYMSNIIHSIFRSYSDVNVVQLKLNAVEIFLELDIAISCGLIINELATNSFKYAFKNCSNPELTIDISKTNSEVKLLVADNGIGFADNFDFRNTESLGMQLVISLVNQIEGTITLNKSNGVKFEINFPINQK